VPFGGLIKSQMITKFYRFVFRRTIISILIRNIKVEQMILYWPIACSMVSDNQYSSVQNKNGNQQTIGYRTLLCSYSAGRPY